jgi:hypothetical protein
MVELCSRVLFDAWKEKTNINKLFSHPEANKVRFENLGYL